MKQGPAVAVTSVRSSKRFLLLGWKEQPLNSPFLGVWMVWHTLELGISIQLLSGEIHLVELLVSSLNLITEYLQLSTGSRALEKWGRGRR